MAIKATATATVTIKFHLSDRWGEDCAVSQIMKQATRSSINFLEKHLGDFAYSMETPKISILLQEEK